MKTYVVFTVAHGSVEPGARIDPLTIKSAGIEIPAVIVGEQGRNRSRGVLPVGGAPQPQRVPCLAGGETLAWPRLMAASVGQTKTGKPKLNWAEAATSTEHVLVVLRSLIGYRGGNEHTGDRRGWSCSMCDCSAHGAETVPPENCPECGKKDFWGNGPRLVFSPRPGQVLASGQIAQGDAGRMGSGQQLVLLLPAGEVLRVGRSGRLYGAPSAHYVRWDGEQLVSLTWDERDAADLF